MKKKRLVKNEGFGGNAPDPSPFSMHVRLVARGLLDRLGEPGRIAEKHFMAAVALDNAQWAQGLEHKVEERTEELTEALEQQTATADILKVISQSPTDVQPVFDAIAERAMILCGALTGAVTQLDSELLHLRAFCGATPSPSACSFAPCCAPARTDLSASCFPSPPDPATFGWPSTCGASRSSGNSNDKGFQM